MKGLRRPFSWLSKSLLVPRGPKQPRRRDCPRTRQRPRVPEAPIAHPNGVRVCSGCTIRGPGWKGTSVATPEFPPRPPGQEGSAQQIPDRPQTLPLSRTLDLLSETVWITHGFKTRPIRDGRGKPSPRTAPTIAQAELWLASVGSFILDVAKDFVPAFQLSLSEGSKHHPFLQEAQEKIRSFILPGHGQPQDSPSIWTSSSTFCCRVGCFPGCSCQRCPSGGGNTHSQIAGRLALEVRALR